ncbi:dihydrofolate reductase family protein [Nocardia sp. 2YAB30]|uniref:dihydrofolate reductase family protein n=1 Tax=unclassified Nocardia TaxID=2637762 RepID=UPI003F9A9F71
MAEPIAARDSRCPSRCRTGVGGEDFRRSCDEFASGGPARPDLPRQPTRRIGADLPGEVADLKNSPGKPVVVFASVRTARGFLRLDAADELRLLVFPILLRAGRRVFDEVAPRQLRLVAAVSFPKSGVVRQSYRRDQ